VGDMARCDAYGFYTLVDRKNNMIISGGENAYPSEVEHAFGGHSKVQDVAVIGRSDAWAKPFRPRRCRGRQPEKIQHRILKPRLLLPVVE
jgi:acyl-CoA synthetase (AMP-forming)/AMP-acid ligase II